MIGLLTIAAYLTLAERKLLGRMQVRYGPNRAGTFGLLQPLADVIKMLTKEDTVPRRGGPAYFSFGPGSGGDHGLAYFCRHSLRKGMDHRWAESVPLVITDLNVGLLYVLALSSISVYGVALGGWASNSKYSLLGGIRGVAQMISYELSLGLSLVPVVMLAGSFSLVDIVDAQARYPFILVQPVLLVPLLYQCGG